jgi:signal transduction histidine kinase
MLDRLDSAAQAQRHLIEQTSHELRTPLSVLMTNADVLLAHPAPTAEVYRSGIERSRSAALRMQATIDELLVDARGRARTIDRRPVDLMEIATEVVDDARVLAAAKSIQLTIAGPSTAIGALDEPTVRRAVSNLVDNAIRYSPSGSSVDVQVEVSPSAATVVVTDHGPGVSIDERDHIFERFWRGRPDTQGTGLGLPIARQVALAHGGDLTVESPGPQGDGCVFVLTLRL